MGHLLYIYIHGLRAACEHSMVWVNTTQFSHQLVDTCGGHSYVSRKSPSTVCPPCCGQVVTCRIYQIYTQCSHTLTYLDLYKRQFFCYLRLIYYYYIVHSTATSSDTMIPFQERVSSAIDFRTCFHFELIKVGGIFCNVLLYFNFCIAIFHQYTRDWCTLIFSDVKITDGLAPHSHLQTHGDVRSSNHPSIRVLRASCEDLTLNTWIFVFKILFSLSNAVHC